MNIKYLVGNKNISNQPSVPFGINELKFLDDFSKILKSDKSTKNKSDILSFSFWCRKKNLIKLSNDIINKNLKIGIGLIDTCVATCSSLEYMWLEMLKYMCLNV